MKLVTDNKSLKLRCHIHIPFSWSTKTIRRALIEGGKHKSFDDSRTKKIGMPLKQMLSVLANKFRPFHLSIYPDRFQIYIIKIRKVTDFFSFSVKQFK